MSSEGPSSSCGYALHMSSQHPCCSVHRSLTVAKPSSLRHGLINYHHFRHREQEKKQRIRGIEAQKANIQAAKTISRMLQSSLGPKGMDKMLQSGDGDVCISKCPFLSHDAVFPGHV